MEGIKLVTPTELYNLLNLDGLYPMLSDPNYLLLLGEWLTITEL